MRKQITYLTHQSTVLEGNPLNDPTERQFPVYLPPGYDDEASRRYPVVWVLAPFTSWGERYLNLKAWNENLVQRAHRLMEAGEAEPCILALPDCFTTLGGSQYVNSSAVGAYQDYVIEELIPFVDNALRTLPEREHRAVMGYSSGGYAAFMLGMAYPELFSAIVSHSGDMGFDYAFQPDIPKAVRQLAEYDSLTAFIDSIGGPDMSNKDYFPTLNLVAMSACYSPNPDAEAGFELPFKRHTGEIIGEVWQRWLDNDPAEITGEHIEALRQMGLIYFDCGVFDEYNLFLGARRVAQTLDAHDVAYTYEEFKGGHRNINWRYDTSLPLVTQAIS